MVSLSLSPSLSDKAMTSMIYWHVCRAYWSVFSTLSTSAQACIVFLFTFKSCFQHLRCFLFRNQQPTPPSKLLKACRRSRKEVTFFSYLSIHLISGGFSDPCRATSCRHPVPYSHGFRYTSTSSCLVLSCLVLSCLALPLLVSSCLVLSCLVVPISSHPI